MIKRRSFLTIKGNNLFVSVVDSKLRDRFLDLHIDRNLEIPLFCLPEILDGDWKGYVNQIKGFLSSNGLTCGMHGPFYNLAYHSRDPKVRGVAEDRMLQGLKIASALDARFIVFHSTYSQFVAIRDYYEKWPSEAMRGLPGIVKEAEEKGVRMVIENIWDDRPDALKGLTDNIGSDFLKICIDVGHINLFSKVPIEQWFKVLCRDISHFHIHNNFGTVDDHNSIDEGSFDFKAFFNLVEKYDIDATFTIEVEQLESVDKSIGFLRQIGVLEED